MGMNFKLLSSRCLRVLCKSFDILNSCVMIANQSETKAQVSFSNTCHYT